MLSLERWLADKPQEVAVVLAARVALRAMPVLATYTSSNRISSDFILPIFRAVATAWVVGRYPTYAPELRIAAASAASASLAVATAVGGFRGYACNAASFASRAASFTGSVVSDSSSAASWASEAWGDYSWKFIDRATVDDRGLIDQGESAGALARQSLWLSVIPGGASEALEQALLKDNPDWKVWTDWYRTRLQGHSGDEALEVARVLIEEEIWKKGPRVVNAEIARLIKLQEE